MPLGVTLLLTIGAAIGTYKLAPEINRTLQKDNARASHILSAISQINSDMISLGESIRRYNDIASEKSEKRDERRDTVYDKIASMQWRLIDLDVLSKDDRDQKDIARFRDSLVKLQSSLQKSDKNYESIPVDVLSEVSQAGYVVLSGLYRRAGVYDVSQAMPST